MISLINYPSAISCSHLFWYILTKLEFKVTNPVDFLNKNDALQLLYNSNEILKWNMRKCENCKFNLKSTKVVWLPFLLYKIYNFVWIVKMICKSTPILFYSLWNQIWKKHWFMFSAYFVIVALKCQPLKSLFFISFVITILAFYHLLWWL